MSLRALRLLWLVPCVLLLWSAVGAESQAADWNIRRTDRWEKIARRLLSLYTARPNEGYALRRLVLHFRRKGGTDALRKRLFLLRKKRPKDRKLRLAEALLSLHVGEYKEAIATLKALLAKPKLSQAEQRRLRWHLARGYFRDQRWGEARRLFLAQLKQTRAKKRQRKILRALIQLDSQRGAWKETRGWYRKLLAMRPRDLELRLGLVQALARNRQWGDAIKQLKKAIPVAPRRRRPDLWSKLVRYHMQIQQYPQALAAIQQARRLLAPGHWLHNALTAQEIDAHRAQKTLPRLIARYHKLSKRSPKRYLPLKARLHVELGQTKEALEAYRLLLKKYPKHPAFTSAVTLLLEQGQTDDAIAWLRRRLKRFPDDEATALQLLEVYHKEQKVTPRNELFARLLKQHAKDEFFLGKLSRKVQPWKDGFGLRMKLYEKLCALKPEARCFEQWGEALWRRKKQKKARQVWEQIRSLKPLQVDDLFILAMIYRRRKWSPQCVSTLQEILQQAPRHIKARRLLGQILIEKKKFREALPQLRIVLRLTRSLRLRAQTRKELLGLWKRLYDPYTLGQRLLREVLLAPFSPEPLRLLLTYHVYTRRRRRVRVYRRISVPLRRRLRLRGRHWRYRRFGRRYRYKYVYRMTPLPAAARQMLEEGLRRYPDDAELRLLALEVDKKKPKAWEHLRRLVLIDLTQSERYMAMLKDHARRYNKGKALVALTQKLCVRWPYQASFWGHLGDVALAQRQVKLGCKAYQRASRLAPKQLAFRLGRARCLAASQRWRRAHLELLKLPHPHQPPLRRRWLQRMTTFGLKAGIPLTSLLASYQKTLSQPIQSILSLIEYLQNDLTWSRSDKHRALLAALIKGGWPMWKRLFLQSKKPRMRSKALLFLFGAPAKETDAIYKQALKDSHSSVRGAGILALGLRGAKQLFYAVDRMERYDRGYDARAAANLAGALMTGMYRKSDYFRAGRWSYYRPWAALALGQQHKQISYRDMSLVAWLYNRSKRPTRWRLLGILEKLSADAAIWLGKMRTHRRYRCFAFDGLSHLQRKQAPSVLRNAALRYRVYPHDFKKYCRYSLYAPK